MADIRVKSEIAGSVWKILKRPGDAVAAEDELLLLESMKMEIPVAAPAPAPCRRCSSPRARPSPRATCCWCCAPGRKDAPLRVRRMLRIG
ncbi:acetyl-CoA carboxylase biotin carboxyl carrier protein subunit [Paeniroseomonas aquatica]|uniref:acetyl-CoA carboxylase biotin carboxyl carrier protein subunit n=1 Tax=Paeniroseomonas aquatica TaxID=373043 RepID=UPI00361B0619